RGRFPRSRPQHLPRLAHELLHPPIERVGDQDLVLGAHRDVVRFAEPAERLALLAHDTEHIAVEIELDDLAGVAVREPEVLIAPDEESARRAGKLRFTRVSTFVVEDLDTLVVAVGNIDQTPGVDCDRMREVELARTGALLAPDLDEIAVL